METIVPALMQRYALQAMQIADTTLGSAAASVTFDKLPGLGYAQGTSLLAVTSARKATSGSVDTLFLRFNADAAANYRYEVEQGAGSLVTAGLFDPDSGIWLALVPTSTAPGGYFGTSLSIVPIYAGTTWTKNVISYGWADDGSVTPYVTMSGGTWLNTAAITSLTFALKTGVNFASGSRFSVYLLP
jgi:hypothetical protein